MAEVTVLTHPGAFAATRKFVEDQFASKNALLYIDDIDASTNPDYPAADKGHVYKISVAGKIGGASGPNVEQGDTITCKTDSTASGDHATVGANWNIEQANIDGAVTGPASSTANNVPKFSGTSGKVLVDSGISINALAVALGAVASSELTIASGAITLTSSSHTVDTESDAATDNLDTVNMGVIADGGFFALAPASASRVTTIRHGAGNYVSPTGANLRLDRPTLFQKSADGASFTEISGAAVSRGVIAIDDYGARGDVVLVTDGVVSSGDQTVTSASSVFTGREGQKIALYRAAAAGGETYTRMLKTTIASVNGPTSIEITATPGANANPAWIAYGTDDTAAYQAAMDAVNAAGPGAILYWTAGKSYWVEGSAVAAHSFEWAAEGARIFGIGLDYSATATVASTIVEPLLTTPGYTHFNSTSDPANHVADTTLSADMNAGEIEITVGSTAGLKKGMGLYFLSTEPEYAVELPDIDYYKRGEYNEIAAIIDGNTIRMRWTASRTYSRDGGAYTVTVKAFNNIESVHIHGGRYYGHKFAEDTINGAGQHFFVLKHVSDALLENMYFEGVDGYPVYTMYGHTRAKKIIVDGRPADLAWNASATSHYGSNMSHAARVRMDECEGHRVRHVCDAGASTEIETHDCLGVDTNTSAFRTHIQVSRERHFNPVADGCYTGFASDAVDTLYVNPVVKNGGTWGFQTADDRELSPRRKVVMVNPQFRLTGGNSLSGQAIASAISFEGPYDQFFIVGAGEIEIVGGGAASHLIRATTDGGIDACDMLRISGQTLRQTGGHADARAIIIGASTNNNVIKGVVEDNTLYCPDQSVLIELFDGDGSPDADDLIIRRNQEMSPSPTASAVVTQNGSNYGSNVHIYNNPLLAETAAEGGGTSITQDSNIEPQFVVGTTDATTNPSSNYVTRTFLGPKLIHLQGAVNTTSWSGTGSLSIDDMLPSPAALNGVCGGLINRITGINTDAVLRTVAGDTKIRLVEPNNTALTEADISAGQVRFEFACLVVLQ